MRVVVKTIAIVLLFVLMCFADSFAQTYKPVPKAATTVTKDTLINNQKVSIYTGSKGGRYILVQSKKGNTYKKYLPH